MINYGRQNPDIQSNYLLKNTKCHVSRPIIFTPFFPLPISHSYTILKQSIIHIDVGFRAEERPIPAAAILPFGCNPKIPKNDFS
jgi:hypothetical protein